MYVLFSVILFTTQLLVLRHAPMWITMVYVPMSTMCVVGLLYVIDQLKKVRADQEVIIKNQNILDDNLASIAGHLMGRLQVMEKRGEK